MVTTVRRYGLLSIDYSDYVERTWYWRYVAQARGSRGSVHICGPGREQRGNHALNDLPTFNLPAVQRHSVARDLLSLGDDTARSIRKCVIGRVEVLIHRFEFGASTH